MEIVFVLSYVFLWNASPALSADASSASATHILASDLRPGDAASHAGSRLTSGGKKTIATDSSLSFCLRFRPMVLPSFDSHDMSVLVQFRTSESGDPFLWLPLRWPVTPMSFGYLREESSYA